MRPVTSPSQAALIGMDLQILNQQVLSRLGRLRYALFDFDGTISLLRQGWEGVMTPMMIEMICGKDSGRVVHPSPEIEAEVRAYISRSTGMLTIRQMEWLAETVEHYGLTSPLSPREYKAIYLERLMGRVRQRLATLQQGGCTTDEMMLAGARAFIASLAQCGVSLFLASGSDHPDVVQEACALGLGSFFDGRIFGALDESEAHDKAAVVRRILEQNRLTGDELLVVGDGPVEIQEAVRAQAIALGVASDEVARSGWNPEKIARLSAAGADLLIPDFAHPHLLIRFLKICGTE